MPGYAGASDVEKLRAAFVWLKDNNPYYQNVEWREDWAEEWRKDDVDIGQTREEDMDDGESLIVSRESFRIWMRSAERHRAAETHGFEMGQRLLALCESAGDHDDESADEWNRIRSLVAVAFDCQHLRAAQTVSRDQLAAMMHHYEAIDFEGTSVMTAKDLCKAIGSLQPEQFPSSLELLHSEILLVCEEAAREPARRLAVLPGMQPSGNEAANPGSAPVHRSVATIRACAACWSPDPPMCPSCTESRKQKKAHVPFLVTHGPVFRFF